MSLQVDLCCSISTEGKPLTFYTLYALVPHHKHTHIACTPLMNNLFLKTEVGGAEPAMESAILRRAGKKSTQV